MSVTALTLIAAFGPEARFELAATPLPSGPFRATAETALDRLKHRLLADQLNGESNPTFNALYRRAANKAAAIAEVTDVPLLVFPSLFEELAGKLAGDFDRVKRSVVRQHLPMVEAA